LFNTHFWVDRTNGLTAAVYTQVLPFLEPQASQLYADFEEALYSLRRAPSGEMSAERRRGIGRPGSGQA
jgi:hypothetical protein